MLNILSMHLFLICTSSIYLLNRKYLFRPSAHSWIVWRVFLARVIQVLYIFWVSILIRYMICKSFLPFSRLPFHFVHGFLKEMATHSSILAWRIPWREEPGRLQSTGSQRVRHDWVTSLSLCYAGSFYLDVVLLVFCLFDFAFCIKSKKSSPRPMTRSFSSVAQLCLTLCNPMDCSTPGFPIHHQLLKLIQTHVHRVSAYHASFLLAVSGLMFKSLSHFGLPKKLIQVFP